MADSDAPAVTKTFGQFADIAEIECRRINAEIEMQIEIEVIDARELEHPIDLPTGIRVGVGCRADHTATLRQGSDHEFVGARFVEQAFLRKDADLNVDGPAVFLDQRTDALESTQADPGVDFELGPYVRSAVEDAAFQGTLAAGIDVCGSEAGLGPRHFPDRLVEIATLGSAAIEDRRLVEMDVTFDESGRHQMSAAIDLTRVRAPAGHAVHAAAPLAPGSLAVRRRAPQLPWARRAGGSAADRRRRARNPR